MSCLYKNLKNAFILGFLLVISCNAWALPEQGSQDIKRIAQSHLKGWSSFLRNYYNPAAEKQASQAIKKIVRTFTKESVSYLRHSFEGYNFYVDYGPDFITLTIDGQNEKEKKSSKEISDKTSTTASVSDSLSKMAFGFAYNAVLGVLIRNATSAIPPISGIKNVENYANDLQAHIEKAIDESNNPDKAREMISEFTLIPNVRKLKQDAYIMVHQMAFKATHPHLESYLGDKGVFKKADRTISEVQTQAMALAAKYPVIVAGAMATAAVGSAAYTGYETYKTTQENYKELQSVLAEGNTLHFLLKLHWHARNRYSDVASLLDFKK